MADPVKPAEVQTKLSDKDSQELAQFRAQKEREDKIKKIMAERDAISPRTFSEEALRKIAEAQLDHDEKHLAAENAAKNK